MDAPRTVRWVSEKSLEIQANEALRAAVRKIVKDQFSGDKTKAAKAIGISASMLSEFLKGTRGAGNKTLLKLAKFTGRSMDSLSGVTTTIDPGEDRRYPVSALGNRPEWPDLKKQLESGKRNVNPYLVEELAHLQFSNAPERVLLEFVFKQYDAVVSLYGDDYEGPEKKPKRA